MDSVVPAIFAFFLFLYYLISKLKTPKKNLPPQAGGARPITGHLHLLKGTATQQPHQTLGALADKYGPIFTIKAGVHTHLVVSSAEVAKELYTTHDLSISSRPQFIASKHMGYNLAMFSQSPYGAYWREIRKIAAMELLSRRRLELLKHVRVSEVDTFIKDLYNSWKEKKDDSGRLLVEMRQWFGELNLNVMIRMVAGKRYFDANMTSAEREEAERIRIALRDLFHLLGIFVMADAVPFLRFLDIGGYEKAMKKTAKDIDIIIQRWVDEHRQKLISDKADECDHDFIDVLISTIGDAKLGGYEPDDIIKAQCSVLVAGSADTTTIMLIWALALIMNHPKVMEKVKEELDIHVGKHRKLEESDINNLVYLQAIIKETLRLYPAGQLGGPREFDEDCTVHGYHVPKGTRLIVNLWKLHRDPRVWEDPFAFKPERFLTSNKDIDVKGQNFELLPFGAGRRMCPAYTFGLHMLHLPLAKLLHAFDFSTPGNVPVDMTEGAGLTNIKDTPFDVLIAPRLSPDLY